MELIVKHGSAADERSDLLVLCAFQGVSQLGPQAASVNKQLDGSLTRILKDEGFGGKTEEWVVFPSMGKTKAKRIGVIGLGEKKVFDLDAARKLGGQVVKHAHAARAKRVTVALPSIAAASPHDFVQAFAEGVRLAAYRFHLYKGKGQETGDRKRTEARVQIVTVCEEERGKVSQMERGLEEARVLIDATNFVRDLVNTPSAEMTPEKMAEIAQSLAARSSGISVRKLSAEQMKKMGMHAALAVGRGSEHEPVGIHLTYKPRMKLKKKIALVGKAVTFDSGGLSLKPADGMMTMKIDMAGAAAVLGVFRWLAQAKPSVEVHGIFLAVENMPSGAAYRPGDIVKAMNGTTIEILNTDAEGRVTLADALSYAARLAPDQIIDLATLTGACVVALGEEVAGFMTNHTKLGERLLASAKAAGEPLWELPLYEPYRELVKSKIADIKNIGGGRWGGAITAAWFLRYFVGNIPWAHIDIAGPSYAEKETRPDLPYGATGYGVRTLARYLQGM